MSAGLIRRYPEEPGGSLALLYFANALGGAVGVLASGFFLVRWWGLPGAMVAAGLLNLTLAAYVWRSVGGGPDPVPQTRRLDSMAAMGRGHAGILVAVAALTGLASFIYEIAWIRMLSLVLSSSTHAFELMLSAFILGIALGGLWIRRRIDRLDSPVRFLAHVQIAMGVLAVATLPVYRGLFSFMDGLLFNLPPTEVGYAIFSFFSHGMALSVMLPATFCAGMTLPLVTLILMRDGGGGERSIGRVYAWNTMGAVVGALAAVHVGLPVLGLKGTLAFGAGLDVAVGLGLLWLMCPARQRGRPVLVSSGAIAAVIATMLLVSLDPVVLNSGVYRRIARLADFSEASVLDQRDGRTATISVLDRLENRSIRTNGKPAASITIWPELPPSADEVVGTLLGGLPVLLKPEARTALNIGMGSGITSHVLLASDALESVTTVEIEAAIVELAPAFAPRNERTFEDPRSRIVIEDARAFLATSRTAFDVIVTQPSNPWVSGNSALFSREFYRLAASSLAPGGVLVQWLQLPVIDTRRVVSILEALRTAFPYFDVYAGTDGDLLLVGTIEARPPRIATGSSISPALLQDLSQIHVRTAQDLEIRLAGTQRTFGPLGDLYGARPNSDFRPDVDQLAARDQFMQRNATELLRLYVQPLPVLELLGETAPTRNRTSVTTSDLFFYSARVLTAMAFRDLVTGLTAPASLPEGPVQRAWANARGLYQQCVDAGSREEAASAVHLIAAAIVADLRPPELVAVWDALDTLPCMEIMRSEDEAWMRLYRAIGAREAEAVVAVGDPLLADGSVEHLGRARLRYLVASVMAAHIGLGNAQVALDRWDAHRARMFAGGADDTFFRQLAALARADRRSELQG
jgi:predicted membrane-bound spermidine synthase